jgi:hypothetical protein
VRNKVEMQDTLRDELTTFVMGLDSRDIAFFIGGVMLALFIVLVV